MWNRPTHLDVMNASFWSRLGEGGLGIERPSEKAAKQALVEPLNAHGVDIDANALAHVAAQSQRYPYFIQLWGTALWQRHPASTTPANGTPSGKRSIAWATSGGRPTSKRCSAGIPASRR